MTKSIIDDYDAIGNAMRALRQPEIEFESTDPSMGPICECGQKLYRLIKGASSIDFANWRCTNCGRQACKPGS